MSTVSYTRQLIEHRYGRPLEELRLAAHHSTHTDPVLPIVLRRLTNLAETQDQARIERNRLEAAWQHRKNSNHVVDELVRSAHRVLDLDECQYQDAEVIWDLLDIRLLLDHPQTSQVTPARPREHQVIDEVMPAARQVAADLTRLNRETLRQGLNRRGIHLSNRRLGIILRRLREERTRL
jgi:hypothetical protein